METIDRAVTVAASPAEVWPALIRSSEISAWFGAEVELDARPGGRGLFRWPDGSERGAVIETVERERRLAFRWLPFQRTADGHAVPVPSTRGQIHLDAAAGGTPRRPIQ